MMCTDIYEDYEELQRDYCNILDRNKELEKYVSELETSLEKKNLILLNRIKELEEELEKERSWNDEEESDIVIPIHIRPSYSEEVLRERINEALKKEALSENIFSKLKEII